MSMVILAGKIVFRNRYKWAKEKACFIWVKIEAMEVNGDDEKIAECFNLAKRFFTIENIS